MTSVLMCKGSTYLARGERRTPSLCKGLSPWAAARDPGLRAPAPSLNPNRACSKGSWNAESQRLPLGSRPFASFGQGPRRCLEALQGPLPARGVAVLPSAASATPMRYNNAAQSDAFRSALIAPTPSAPGRER
jgi:hypothetical protein